MIQAAGGGCFVGSIVDWEACKRSLSAIPKGLPDYRPRKRCKMMIIDQWWVPCRQPFSTNVSRLGSKLLYRIYHHPQWPFATVIGIIKCFASLIHPSGSWMSSSSVDIRYGQCLSIADVIVFDCHSVPGEISKALNPCIFKAGTVS